MIDAIVAGIAAVDVRLFIIFFAGLGGLLCAFGFCLMLMCMPIRIGGSPKE